MAFHPTKNLVASCSSDKSVKLWNADTGAELWTVNVDSSVYSVVVFDTQTNEQICSVTGHTR